MEPVSIVVGTLCRPLRHKGDYVSMTKVWTSSLICDSLLTVAVSSSACDTPVQRT